MSAIFISHASSDTTFATRLALEIADRSIPVWLDTWSLDYGDALTGSLSQAIASAGAVIVVLSETSVASRWVQKEVELAVAAERQLNRKLLFPVLLSSCKLPSSIEDRVCADFSCGFLAPLERLLLALTAAGVRADLSAERQLVPLFFDSGRFLDQSRLEHRLAFLWSILPRRSRLTPQQLLPAPDAALDELYAAARHRLENIAQDAFYSTELKQRLTSTLRLASESEHHLSVGVSHLANMFALSNGSSDIAAHSAHWFARINRTRFIRSLWLAQTPGPARVAFGRDCVKISLATAEEASALFGAIRVERCSVAPTLYGPNAVNVWVDGDSRAFTTIATEGPLTLAELASTMLVEKWVIPQVIDRYLSAGFELPSSFTGWTIGLA